MVNTYDNNLKADQVWEAVERGTRSRALAEPEWDRILEGRTVLLADFNTHGHQLNIYYGETRDTVGLKALIEAHDLIWNNEPGKATRPTRGQVTSIIDLKFTTSKLGALDS